jgi:RNA polymerase sigma-70 factor (ECF subfamily)
VTECLNREVAPYESRPEGLEGIVYVSQNDHPVTSRDVMRLGEQRARLSRAFDQNYTAVWCFLRGGGVPSDRADDIAQQVFLIALEALPRITEGSERAFLYGTAVRLAHGVRRRGNREGTRVSLDPLPSPLPSPDQLTDQKRARETLDAIVASLDVDTRTVFVLTEFDGFTTPQIADVLDVPIGTVASRLRRAREKLRTMVRKVYGDYP